MTSGAGALDRAAAVVGAACDLAASVLANDLAAAQAGAEDTPAGDVSASDWLG